MTFAFAVPLSLTDISESFQARRVPSAAGAPQLLHNAPPPALPPQDLHANERPAGPQAVSYAISLVSLLQLIFKFIGISRSPLARAEPERPPAVGWDLGVAGAPPPPSLRLARNRPSSLRQPPRRPDGPPGPGHPAAEVAFWSWCISFAVPMLLDEIDPAVPVGQTLLLSFGHRALLDLLLGLSGAAAFPRLGPSSLNVLNAVAAHPECGPVTRGAGILFVVFSLAPNVVDYAMASRTAPRALFCCPPRPHTAPAPSCAGLPHAAAVSPPQYCPQ